MKYFFPPQNQNYTYLQTNRSDELGSLWSSFNLDFQTNLGAMRLAQKLVINTNDDVSGLGLPVAFEYFDDRWWAVCGTKVFKNSSEQLTSTFSEDTSTGAQTDYNSEESDLAVFNDRLWSTTTDNLYSKASGSGTGDWTSRDALGAGIHQMTYFKKFDRLYYVDGDDTISSIDTSDVVASSGSYFLDLGLNATEDITCIKAGSQNIWIGTRSTSNSTTSLGLLGHIFQWDGISAQPTATYDFTTAGVLALVVLMDIPYAIDTEGRVLKYTGYAFEEIARLPINRILLQRSTSTGSDGTFVYFNGMVATKNNTLLILVNNINDDSVASYTENLPSGIWELDLATGNFTHRYSPTLKNRTSSTITDYGASAVVRVGAIKLNTMQNDSSNGRSSLICGIGYYTNATDGKDGIFIDSPAAATTDNEGQKRGYFVTTWFNSLEVEDKFQRLWDIHKRFVTSTDKIVYKYRLTEVTPVRATITWTSTTTFTTTTDVSAYAPTASPFNGTTGGEVEILHGTGAGSCTHISSITEAGGTYTVTLDTAVTGVTGTAKARFQKWIKMYPEVTGQVKSWEQLAIGANNTQIQIKCCMEFTGEDEFQRFAIFSNEDIKINP